MTMAWEAELTMAIRARLDEELAELLGELCQLRSDRLAEGAGSSREAYLRRRVELARDKLDLARRLHRREKEVQARRREIERENDRRHRRRSERSKKQDG